jgi:hypothetical protein
VSVYKAVGFRTEGRLKKLFFIDGAWVDVLLMATFRPPRNRRDRAGGLARNENNSADDIATRQFQTV